MALADELRAALAQTNVRAFLCVIRAGESSQTEAAYRMLFGGELVTDLSRHPNRVITRGSLSSTAAGAYQFLHRTWVECAAALDLKGFSPADQDLAAVFLIRRRGALADVLAGRISAAIAKCNREWASLPGSPYSQPTRTLAQALTTYAVAGGVLEGVPAPGPTPTATAPDQPEKAMPLPLIIGALLPSLIEAIPKLGKLFGSGSDVAERNVAAATLAVQIAQDAVGARNAQEAVETIKADPIAAQAAQAAVESRWLELTEAGGDGIAGARKADAATQVTGDMKHSPSFWIAAMLLPIVYMLVASLIGILGTVTWSDEIRASLAGSLVSLIIGGMAGYFWGQTTTRNRTPSP